MLYSQVISIKARYGSLLDNPTGKTYLGMTFSAFSSRLPLPLVASLEYQYLDTQEFADGHKNNV